MCNGNEIYIPETKEIVTIKNIVVDIFKKEYIIYVNKKEITSNNMELKIYEEIKKCLVAEIRELTEIKNKYEKLVEAVKDHNNKNISDRLIWGSKVKIE